MDYKYRLQQLRDLMEQKELSTIFVFNPDHQFYLSGFKAFTYSRPIVLSIDLEQSTLVLPGLEEVHAKDAATVDNILVYYEHPMDHPVKKDHMEWIEDILQKYPSGATIGVDVTSIPGNIIQVLQKRGFNVTDIGEVIERMRYVKDASEIEWLEKAGELVNLAVSKSIEAIKIGTTEMEIDADCNTALFAETARKYPNATLDLNVMSPSGVKRSVMPHMFSNTREIKPGDVIIHTRQVGLNGYRAELERTVIVGEPTDEQKRAFEVAVEAQRRTIDFIKPGVKASEVDLKAREIIDQAGLGQYAIHRIGHGIGLSAHEKPFLRYDNEDLIIEEGMVFSIEPGIYIPNVGGFRHSDTVIITSDGCRLITEYPYEVNDLIL